MDTPTKPHAELHEARTKLKDILQSVSSFSPSVARPPIIDSSFDSARNSAEGVLHQDAVKGLRTFKDTVQRDLDVLEKFLADPNHAHLPALSTNAPYLISVWNEAVLAPPPVTAIWSTFSENGQVLNHRRRGLPREAGVKVDVVADGGKRWIRVNTTKNSRMLAEFREIDSYLTDSDDASEQGTENELPSLAQTEFDNSVLRMGRSLLAAARENPIIGTAEVPAVTLRLTRLDPTPSSEKDNDPRIAQTIDELLAMGIDVQLGERNDTELAQHADEGAARPPQFCPTTNINLDLSILIALVSDLTHADLPTSTVDAEARFTPSSEYLEWKKKRVAVLKNGAPDCSREETAVDLETELIIRPSRALVSQVLQELNKGLFDEMKERLAAVLHPSSAHHLEEPSGLPAVAFWTTTEAKERCLQIVAKIGGPQEKRRAEALFCTDASKAHLEFWRGSRYPPEHIPLFPMHIYSSSEGSESPARTRSFANDERHLSPFFPALAKTCRGILAQETMPHPRATQVSTDGDDLGEIQRATVTKANPRLTAHTVQSILLGAERGWTTLTANKTSVKAILREMRAARGGLLWNRADELDLDDSRDNTTPISVSGSLPPRTERAMAAAIWMVDPRSLAEGMRADYGMYDALQLPR